MSACLPRQAVAAQGFNSTQFAQVVSAIQQYANSVGCNVTATLLIFDNLAIELGGAAVTFLIITGALLYFSRLNKRLGKDLLEGGILIAIFLAYGVSYLLSVHL